jgi:hypothetical protein
MGLWPYKLNIVYTFGDRIILAITWASVALISLAHAVYIKKR